LQRRLRGEDTHVAQRLTDSSERRVLKGRRLHIVESYDGDVLGNAQACLAQGADRPNGRDVVEGEDGGEVAAGREQALGGLEAGLMRGLITFELADEFRWQWKLQMAGNVANGAPSGLRIGTGALALDDGDPPVVQESKMAERELGCAAVVDRDVDGAGELVVAGDADRRDS